jgi:hypothetical protein
MVAPLRQANESNDGFMQQSIEIVMIYPALIYKTYLSAKRQQGERKQSENSVENRRICAGGTAEARAG